MLIELTVGLSGNEYSLGPGDRRDFPNDEAIRLMEAGYAIPVADEDIERAVSVPFLERRKRRGKNNKDAA